MAKMCIRDSLGVDHQRGDVLAQRLLHHHHAQPGLAAAGHADDHPVRGEIVGFEGHGLIGAVAGVVEKRTELEGGIGHGGCSRGCNVSFARLPRAARSRCGQCAES